MVDRLAGNLEGDGFVLGPERLLIGGGMFGGLIHAAVIARKSGKTMQNRPESPLAPEFERKGRQLAPVALTAAISGMVQSGRLQGFGIVKHDSRPQGASHIGIVLGDLGPIEPV